ncbi:helix-turn-helix domain-containing protein [Glycomyces harbinensis]|uniref:Helix-turn-helix domain-containing protein n=1 Tax=Glycomyces harbinensis TaxID=58114 RepID=A0A1G6QQ45_9ACTN|nr:helix-turn-helix transcriptional regulator [Glycomyces harbinensis]SDC93866.1 Helix-turn-helix domain-containing protein [Glycomyces harbinensis]
MDRRQDAADFLKSRRDRMTPDKAGVFGSPRRRVPGLRREEVAFLAGVSVDYYVRMERGDLRGVSPEVLDALARALQLDEAETAYLHDLAAAAGPGSRRRREKPADASIRPGLQRFIDAVTGAAVTVQNRRGDIVAANALGRALYAPVLGSPAGRGNTARFLYLDPTARSFWPDWESIADQNVASLRSIAGQHPHDKGLHDLIGELVTRSDAFRVRWASHDVRFHRTGVKRLHHPEVGELELAYETMDLPASPELRMTAYTAAPDTPGAERLALLGSLAASGAEPEDAEASRRPT